VPLLSSYVVILHYFACGYWLVVTESTGLEEKGVCADCEGLSEWMPTKELLLYGDMLRWYLRALYFAISNLTGLGKDLAPDRQGPLLFTLFVWVCGVLVFAYLTSSIVTLVMNANVARASFQQKKLETLAFMQMQKIDPDIIRGTKQWLERWWHAHGGTSIDAVLDTLPPSLRRQLVSHIFLNTASEMPLFAQPEVRVSAGIAGVSFHMSHVLHFLVDHARFSVLNEGAWVLRQGMLNDRFGIILLGRAQVILDESSGEVFNELGPGDIIGEHSSLLAKGIGRCDASVLAKTEMSIVSFERRVMQAALKMSGGVLMRRLEALDKRRTCEDDFYRSGRRFRVGSIGRMLLAQMREQGSCPPREKTAAAEKGGTCGPSAAAAPKVETNPLIRSYTIQAMRVSEQAPSPRADPPTEVGMEAQQQGAKEAQAHGAKEVAFSRAVNDEPVVCGQRGRSVSMRLEGGILRDTGGGVEVRCSV